MQGVISSKVPASRSTNTPADVAWLQSIAERAQRDELVLGEEERHKVLVALQSSKHLKQQWAANVVSFLCASSPTNRISFGPKAVKGCCRLLRSKKEKVQAWALCALGNLCIDNSNQSPSD